MPKLDRLFAEKSPDLVLVQGDTTSAFCAGLAAFDRRIPVAHVEAGLRSFDRLNPYPEESNRRMLTAIAELHLAPTEHSAENLRREGVLPSSIVVTGNTVIDALLLALREGNAQGAGSRDRLLEDGDRARTVLITLHRREAWETPGKNGGTMLDGISAGLRRAAKKHPDVEFIYPVHLNPCVQRAARAALGDVDNVRLIDPLPYLRFVETMARSSVIVTDSGGVQEEAPSLGVPVLVVRQTTERPEAVRPGMNQLVGTESTDVERELSLLLSRPRAIAHSLPCPSPFGDGHAAARVAHAVLHFMGLGERPSNFGHHSNVERHTGRSNPRRGTSMKKVSLPSDVNASGRSFGQEELDLLKQVIESGTLNCTKGTMVQTLREALRRRRWARRFARCATSGTAAIHTAIAGDRTRAGRRDHHHADHRHGRAHADPVPGRDSGVRRRRSRVRTTSPPRRSRRKISRPHARRSIVTHLFGNPCEMDAIIELCRAQRHPGHRGLRAGVRHHLSAAGTSARSARSAASACSRAST